MGSHTNSKLLACRLLTLTISMLTFIIFAYYQTNITADMTSGAPRIPIRTFEDVVHYDYKVLTYSPYYANILKSAKPGTAMNSVYKFQFERMKNFEECLKAVLTEPKTLTYGAKTFLGKYPPSVIKLQRQTFPLEMDDSVYAAASFALQKDSEFLQIFNHYIMKAMESGFLNRNFHNHRKDVYGENENYETVEPQPLGFNNVMFIFIVLAIGICLSITKVLMEFLTMKLNKGKKVAWLNRIEQDGDGKDRVR